MKLLAEGRDRQFALAYRLADRNLRRGEVGAVRDLVARTSR